MQVDPSTVVSFTFAANTGSKGKGQRECVMICCDETIICEGRWEIIGGEIRNGKQVAMLFLDITQKMNAILRWI